ncbi:ribonuclease, Rne/Rng family [Actinobacteria bacterium IMCC26256]|nr:ribonuclease, Rne/Rng family [Actinobacteria bacterium IMCC26256]
MSEENSTPNTNTPNSNTPENKTPSSAGNSQGNNASETPRSNTPADAPASGDSSGGSSSDSPTGAARPSGPSLNPDGTPRPRRRRGSRGGKNRKRTPGTGQGGQGSQGQGAQGAQGAAELRDSDEPSGGDDYKDAAADRGLTTEDVAAKAASEAGIALGSDGGIAPAKAPIVTAPLMEELSQPAAEEAPEVTPVVVPEVVPVTTPSQVEQAVPSEPVRPKIGDSRPAPVMPASTSQGAPSSNVPSNNAPSSNAPSNKSNSNGQGASAQSGAQSDGTTPSGAAKKRRKRGGRGRSRTGGAGGAQGVGAAAGAVNADLGPASDLDDLDEAVRERRRGRSRQGRATGRYTMGVHKAADGGVHLAVLEGRVLTEHYVSRETDDDTSIDGNIYLGRVQNVLPGMEAAFIDISTPKNGVLYRGDVSFDAGEVENQEPRIESLLKNGQMVIVQVTKNPIGAKGARLTQEVSLAGRFVVMVPGQPQTYGISKRLPDEERRRLRKVLDAIRPDDAGLIVRTAAAGASAEELERDLNRLKAEWQVIAAAAKRSGKPCLLHREPALVVRVIREEFNTEYRSIVIDDEVLYNEVRSYVEAIAPELAERVELHVDAPGELPLFERLHIHEQLHKALERKVWLPSGGSLIIERTEALTVIDVNTGKNVGRSNLEETVFQNNLEAAAEVAHQLRLRDIGGIIVIDFIDMEVKRNRDEVVRVLRDALARDKTRTQVFEISELGLVEMTRKRISEGLVESFSEVCPTCAGRGFTVDQSML